MKKKKLTKRERSKISQLNKKLEQAKLDKKNGIGFIITGIVFILFFGSLWTNRNYEIKQDELISIEGTIANKLELIRKKTVGRSMIIRLSEYLKIDYRIGRFGIRRMNVNLLENNIKIGDKIRIDIMKDDYIKINSNIQRTIAVYGVKDDKNEYLTVDDYNWAKKKDGNSIAAYPLLGFSFWTFGYGIYLFLKSKKSISNFIES